MSRQLIEIANAAVRDLPDKSAAAARDRMRAIRRRIRVGIITALPLEASAVSTVLGGKKTVMPIGKRTQVSYYIHTFTSSRDGSPLEVVVALANQMGNNAAAVTAASLLMDFEGIEDLLVVGIAGGIPLPRVPDRHVRLGDVVVGLNGIVQYDYKKIEVSHSELRKMPPAPSARLTGAVQQIRVEEEDGIYPWEPFLLAHPAKRPRLDQLRDPSDPTGETLLSHPRRQIGRRPGVPLVHYGLIGSANVLLKSPEERDKLAAEHRLQAVEMEGSGIADAAWNFSKGYIVVRAICDYCDMHKNNMWQHYAAAASAAYARTIVERALATSPFPALT